MKQTRTAVEPGKTELILGLELGVNMLMFMC